MKVLQINTVCGRGSTGRIATDLLKCLKEKGYFGKIAYGIGPMLNAESSETIEIDTKLEYYVHNLFSRFLLKPYPTFSVGSSPNSFRNLSILSAFSFGDCLRSSTFCS